MDSTVIPFGEFLPDSPDFSNPGLTVCQNAVASGNGYSLMPGASAIGDALDARAKGGFSALYGSTVEDFVGTGLKLFRLTLPGGTWSDVSQVAGSPYSGGDWVDFTQFGNELISVNGGAVGNDVPQVWTLGTSTNFADLGGSPPNAATVAAVRDFVVVGHTYDGTDGEVPFRVRWSGFANSGSWAVNAATQADFQDLNSSGGPVRRVMGGEVGYVFQEKSIYQMVYEGPPTIFRFSEIAPGIGTPAPKSVVQYGGTIFFMGPDGFYALPTGGAPTPIGRDKVDRTVLGSLTVAELPDVIGVLNKEYQAITWLYDADLSAGGEFTKGVTYSIKNGKWSEFSPEASGMGIKVDYAYTSRIATAQRLDVPVFFNSADDSARAMVNVTPIAARFDTGDLQFYKDRFSTVHEARLLFNFSAMLPSGMGLKMASIDSFQLQQSPPTLGSALTQNTTTGVFMCRNHGRHHRFSASFTGATNGLPIEVWGIEVRHSPQGRR